MASFQPSSPYDILVAEDSQNDRDILKEAFSQLGANVRLHFARDGEDALDHLRRSGDKNDRFLPSLVLLDLNMPRMDGSECLRTLRADERLRGLPVVVYSTSVNPVQINQAYADGANAFLVKPGAFDDLVALMRNLCAFWFESAALPAAAPPF